RHDPVLIRVNSISVAVNIWGVARGVNSAKIRRRAKQRGLSLNGAVISVLAEALDARGSAGGPPYHDLDDLAGSWSAEEAAGFDRALAALRGIDAELWK